MRKSTTVFILGQAKRAASHSRRDTAIPPISGAVPQRSDYRSKGRVLHIAMPAHRTQALAVLNVSMAGSI